MTIEVGQPAPDFTLKDQHGQNVTLSGFRGRKAVVLVFYPFAFSATCTSELRELRDDLPAYDNDEVALLAVSCEPMFGLRIFSDRERLTYPLLSDFWPHGEVAHAYGVFDAERGCALRGTFVLDTGGVVRWKIENTLPDARDLADYRAALARLAA